MSEVQTLDDYLSRRFEPVDPVSIDVPVPPQRHVEWWRAGPAAPGATVEDLVSEVAQFRIDVAEGASKSAKYRRLVLAAGPPAREDVAAGPVFTSPETVDVWIHEHDAGPLPVVRCGDRRDFERCFHALAGRCEPVEVPVAVHALYLAGLPNPTRTRALHNAWLANGGLESDWPIEMRRLKTEDRTTFHDQVVLVHDAPYAGLDASDVDPDYSSDEWIERSRILRLEHECTHHATDRLLGSYRLHVLDELLADLMGFTKATGRFEAAVFLAGLGIHGRDVTPDGRLWTYIGDLDRAGIGDLVDITTRIAANLETIAPLFITDDRRRLRRLLVLASDGMDRLQDADWPDRFSTRIEAGEKRRMRP